MPTVAVVGAQWGDEGKGRVVDWLAARADVVVRYQGGDNAGHTVRNEFGTFKLHGVPSGIFRPSVRCVIGAGCVVNPAALLAELAGLERAGIPTANLWIDERAQLVLPYHLTLDGLEEDSRVADPGAGGSIGTTRRGIGPCYTDKAARRGLRAGDLLRPGQFAARLAAAARWHDVVLGHFGRPPVDQGAVLAAAAAWQRDLGARIVDTTAMLDDAVDAGDTLLLEGQLGIMRDLDWGAWPYVTSSAPTAGYAAQGAGLGARGIDEILGVAKAYVTAVGAGPLPTELHDEVGAQLRHIGDEFGATTGRPRRCGWLDAVALRHAVRRNGLHALVLTKLDVLDALPQVQVAVAYDHRGTTLQRLPSAEVAAECTVVYRAFSGWQQPTGAARRWTDLPGPARAYVRAVEALAGVPITFVSVGAERDAIVAVPAVAEEP